MAFLLCFQILNRFGMNLCVCIKTCPMLRQQRLRIGLSYLILSGNDKYRTCVYVCQYLFEQTFVILFRYYGKSIWIFNFQMLYNHYLSYFKTNRYVFPFLLNIVSILHYQFHKSAANQV